MPTANGLLSKPVISLNQGKNCGVATNLLFDQNLKTITHLLVFDQVECTYLIVQVDKIKKTDGDAIVLQDNADLLLYDGKALNPINFDVYDTNGKHLGFVNEIVFSKNFNLQYLLCRDVKITPSQICAHSFDTLVIKPLAKPKQKNIAQSQQPTTKGNVHIEKQNDEQMQKTSANVEMFIIGRKCDKNILNRFNEVIIKQGSIITPEIVKKAKLTGKLVELSMHAVK